MQFDGAANYNVKKYNCVSGFSFLRHREFLGGAMSKVILMDKRYVGQRFYEFCFLCFTLNK